MRNPPHHYLRRHRGGCRRSRCRDARARVVECETRRETRNADISDPKLRVAMHYR